MGDFCGRFTIHVSLRASSDPMNLFLKKGPHYCNNATQLCILYRIYIETTFSLTSFPEIVKGILSADAAYILFKGISCGLFIFTLEQTSLLFLKHLKGFSEMSKPNNCIYIHF